MLTRTDDSGPIVAEDDELADLAALLRLIETADDIDLILSGGSGDGVRLSPSAVRVLRQAIPVLARDQIVVMSRLTRSLTSVQAADLLGVPHLYLLDLLDQGAIPARIEFNRPHLRFEDVIEYGRQRDTERRRILDEMAQETQEIQRLQDLAEEQRRAG